MPIDAVKEEFPCRMAPFWMLASMFNKGLLNEATAHKLADFPSLAALHNGV